MINTEILEKLKDYLENEYRSVVKLITREVLPFWCHPAETKKMSLDRGMGAVLYAQYLGAAYEDVNIIYEEFKAQIEAIIPTEQAL